MSNGTVFHIHWIRDKFRIYQAIMKSVQNHHTKMNLQIAQMPHDNDEPTYRSIDVNPLIRVKHRPVHVAMTSIVQPITTN